MDLSSLTNLDYGVFAIIGISTIFAFFRGFIGSLLSLIGWIASIYLAYELYPQFKPLLASKISSEVILLMTGHSILLGILLIAFAIFNAIVGSIFKRFTATSLDKLLGFGFGALRGGLIVAFMFMVFATSMSILKKGEDENGKKSEDDIMPKFVTESQTYSYLKTGRDVLTDFIPQSFNERAKQAINSITEKASKSNPAGGSLNMLGDSIPEEELNKLINTDKEAYKGLSEEEAKKRRANDLINKYGGKAEKPKDTKSAPAAEDEKDTQQDTPVDGMVNLDDLLQ